VAAAAACIAESGVIFKLLPRSHPVSVNAIALTTGSTILFLVSLLAGEIWTLPINGTTWFAFGYLTLVGSVALFYLFLFVLGRWTASATSFAFLLFPVATVIIAAPVSGERVTPFFILGTTLVLTGVVVGAFGQPSQDADAVEVHSPEHIAFD
jgi:drug/metabolite transporter (DMT)-like permease